MDVLRYLDVLVGLSLVMLLGCSVVAAAVQWLTTVSRSRARYLEEGLSDVIQALDPDIPDDLCRQICRLLVHHPLVARPESWWDVLRRYLGRAYPVWHPRNQAADAVLRHEILRIVLEWASGEGVYGRRLDLALHTERLRAALEANGVASPGQALASVRLQTLQQERSNPSLPAHEWHTMAMIDACPSALVSKLTAWYDSTATRTSQRFKAFTQTLTAVAALAFALALPLDSVALIKRLSTDEELRKELVQQAQSVVQQKQQAPDSVPEDQLKKARSDLELLLSPRLNLIPAEAQRWAPSPGVLLSWVLLSLGAPFWYDLLKNTLRFRSLIAQKDDQERKDRQQGHTTATAGGARPAAAAVPAATTAVAPVAEPEDESGEKADLVAVG